MTGCFGLDWTSEIEMSDGKSIVVVKQYGYHIRVEIGPREEDDRDVIIIEDNVPWYTSFWLSLPQPGNNDIYILDCSDLVQSVQSKRYKIHVIKDYMADTKTNSIEWMDPEINRTRDTYRIHPSDGIKKENN